MHKYIDEIHFLTVKSVELHSKYIFLRLFIIKYFNWFSNHLLVLYLMSLKLKHLIFIILHLNKNEIINSGYTILHIIKLKKITPNQ